MLQQTVVKGHGWPWAVTGPSAKPRLLPREPGVLQSFGGQDHAQGRVQRQVWHRVEPGAGSWSSSSDCLMKYSKLHLIDIIGASNRWFMIFWDESWYGLLFRKTWIWIFLARLSTEHLQQKTESLCEIHLYTVYQEHSKAAMGYGMLWPCFFCETARISYLSALYLSKCEKDEKTIIWPSLKYDVMLHRSAVLKDYLHKISPITTRNHRTTSYLSFSFSSYFSHRQPCCLLITELSPSSKSSLVSPWKAGAGPAAKARTSKGRLHSAWVFNAVFLLFWIWLWKEPNFGNII